MFKRMLVGGLLMGAFVTAGHAASATSANDISLLRNKTPVEVTGTVSEIRGNEFTLTYEGGYNIDVDVGHWGQKDAARFVSPGQQVSVSGEIEKRIFSDAEIRPYSLSNLSTNMEYEEGANRYEKRTTYQFGDENLSPDEVIRPDTQIRGEVTNVQGRNVQMRTSRGLVTIDTLALPYDPTSNKVFPKIEVGDTVSFQGRQTADNRIRAQKIVNVQKPYKSEAYEKQVVAPDRYVGGNE